MQSNTSNSPVPSQSTTSKSIRPESLAPSNSCDWKVSFLGSPSKPSEQILCKSLLNPKGKRTKISQGTALDSASAHRGRRRAAKLSLDLEPAAFNHPKANGLGFIGFIRFINLLRFIGFIAYKVYRVYKGPVRAGSLLKGQAKKL